MASAPDYKVYIGKDYVAAFKSLFHAIAFVGAIGIDGMTVRKGHDKKWAVWTEGAERISAGESFDEATEIALENETKVAVAAAKRLVAARS